MSLAEFAEAPVLSLEAQMEQLSLESNILTNMIQTLRGLLPGLNDKLKTLKQSFSSMAIDMSDEDYKSLSKDQQKAIKNIASLKYLTFSENIIDIPESFTGNLREYAEVLTKINTTTFAEAGPVISEYNTILASFITNKADKISLKDHTALFNRIAKQRAGCEKEVGVFFKVKTDRSIAKMSHVFSNFKDVEKLFLASAGLAKSQDPLRLKKLQADVQACVDLLDIIIKQVDDDGVGSISPEATKNIAQGAFEIAKYVELIGINYYRGIVLLHAQAKLASSFAKM